jgi:hypothetical protein
MIQFDLTYTDLKKNISSARKGMIIVDTGSEMLTRYIIKDVINGSPILIEIGDKHKTVVPNWIGDYMLNLRTGYISVVDSGEHHISRPLANMKIGDYELSMIRKDLNI